MSSTSNKLTHAELFDKYPELKLLNKYPRARRLIGILMRNCDDLDEASDIIRVLLDEPTLLLKCIEKYPSPVRTRLPTRKVTTKHVPIDFDALRKHCEEERAKRVPESNVNSPAIGNAKVWQAMSGGLLMRRHQNEFSKIKDPDSRKVKVIGRRRAR